MKYIKYTKYIPELADEIDLNNLMSRLSDFFLQSGFESQYYGISEMDTERSLEQLRQAILRALQEGDLLDDELMQELMQDPDLGRNQKLKDLIDQLIERLTNEGYIAPQPP